VKNISKAVFLIEVSTSFSPINKHAKVARVLHGIKGFVIPTKSFVEIGITKKICYNN